MRKYETVFIADPDLSDQARADLFDKVRNIIANEKGILLDFDEWGNKKLAYEVKKKQRGHYVCATYAGTGDLVKEIERNFRLTDDVMKFMTIVLSEDMPAEAFEQEAEEAAARKAEETEETVSEDEPENVEEADADQSDDEPLDEEAAAETKEETE